MPLSYLIGIDVGSAEVRCGLVDNEGTVVKVDTKKVGIYNPEPGYFQQSSQEIWDAVKILIKNVTRGIDKNKIKGIGCDATCSLVLIGKTEQPVTVSPKGDVGQDIIMWMDHRAGKEADVINSMKHPLLDCLGGKVSLEMQLPKLMWMKKHLPASFNQTEHFFDLPDFLTWKLTGSTTRSQCSLVCKWMYGGSPDGPNVGWDVDLLKSISLEELIEDDFSKIGKYIAMPGDLIGYVKGDIAEELDLNEGVAVGASLIDAHAGTLGLIATKMPSHLTVPICNKIGMICGTSSCFMLLSENGVKVDGVWGPYYGAVYEDLWLSEGGQSAAGQLLDRLVACHPAKPNASDPGQICSSIVKVLNRMSSANKCSLHHLTRNFHVYPDFRGNRSPLADTNLRGMISGLDLNYDEEQLALVYLAAIQALSYSARQTVEKLEREGLGPVECLVLCGGLSKNQIFIQTLAGALGRLVIIPDTTESVLLGSAMLGAAAASLHPSLTDCALSMASAGSSVQEFDPDILRYHNLKYKVYLKMQEDQIEYRNMMSVAEA